MTIRPVEDGVFYGNLRTDEKQADMTHLIASIRNFANAPNKLIYNGLPVVSGVAKISVLHSIN